ncbi:MAG: hypothetical protein ABIN96_11205, partial [Rubrivivax sp.]
TGVTRAAAEVAGLQVEEGLRRTALAADADGWLRACQVIDEGPLKAALDRVHGGESVQLTLCGERGCRGFTTPLRPRWRRWMRARPDVRALLAGL